MAELSVRGVVRQVLTTNLDLPADDVIRRLRARGVKAPEADIRLAVHKVRSDLKSRQKAAGKAKPAPAAPAAARQTPARPAAAPAKPPAAPAKPPAAAAPAAAPAELPKVLANVALVNRVVGQCGGAANARQVVEAVKKCGGLDAFLLHLDLVAGIRSDTGAG
jgi:cell division protein FtsN